MNVLVVNGSPRGRGSNTEILTKSFLAGVHELGASSETVYLIEKKIEYCRGEFGCWTKTPGVCMHHDDMPELLEKIKQADVLVLATPLYVYTVSALMKTFMDRLITLAQPTIETKNGVSAHPARYANTIGKIVVISNCGFIEQDHFDGLKETMRCWFRTNPQMLAGMICCAGGELLHVPQLEGGLDWYLDAVKQAGRNVIADGCISETTQAILGKPLMEDKELFISLANAHFESEIAKSARRASEKEAESKSDRPQPEKVANASMHDLLSGMCAAFNPAAANGLAATIQFALTDESPDAYHLAIAGGKCDLLDGRAEKPTLTITTPVAVWRAIASGELNGATAFLSGKYKVSGDMRLLMRFESLFRR
jgi:multimeric flavodoxin WrbA/putative sterol carrier protein